MVDTDRYPKIEVRSRDALRAWLAAHHAQPEGVWLVTYRKHTGASYVSKDAVLDELLAFGWIDGVARKVDDDRTMQLITPRRTHAWTASYRTRALRLETEGRLAEPGRHAIALAKASGGWDAYPEVDALEIPADLGAALDGVRGARVWFEAAAPSYRRNVLRWIAKAQRPPTRASRIATVAETAGRGERIRNL
ncbi:MAG: YdeI/OmpD-associated family protein [Gemmatimonadaceae bacterium]|jgi:uncharacterized protein YdeI (YjbR/CyaY-like superfamily)|nr:YdeI/OmpD-associated family protein [Gemmatimonadaceae bacterium]